MLATRWTGDGEGATYQELGEALSQYFLAHPEVHDSLEVYKGVAAMPSKQRTNLELTGESLQEYDLKRIAREIDRRIGVVKKLKEEP